jgi:hypothetical protein
MVKTQDVKDNGSNAKSGSTAFASHVTPSHSRLDNTSSSKKQKRKGNKDSRFRPSSLEGYSHPGHHDNEASEDLRHDLQGIGSQFSNIAYQPLSSHAVDVMIGSSTCPYHSSILEGRPTNPELLKGEDLMSRYLAQGPSEQYAMFYQQDSGELSTSKDCCCAETIGKSSQYDLLELGVEDDS